MAPVYEYHCQKCNQNVEVTKPISEASEPESCPDCGNEMQRVYKKEGTFILKTKGFYKTDNSKKR